eukprot:Skav221639  [mRNA]  locus=scaffold335:141180:148522:- [translate_table: standard]
MKIAIRNVGQYLKIVATSLVNSWHGTLIQDEKNEVEWLNLRADGTFDHKVMHSIGG